MMVNGLKVSSTATEFGKDCKTTHTLVSGMKAKLMGTACTLGGTEIGTKDTGTCV